MTQRELRQYQSLCSRRPCIYCNNKQCDQARTGLCDTAAREGQTAPNNQADVLSAVASEVRSE